MKRNDEITLINTGIEIVRKVLDNQLINLKYGGASVELQDFTVMLKRRFPDAEKVWEELNVKTTS